MQTQDIRHFRVLQTQCKSFPVLFSAALLSSLVTENPVLFARGKRCLRNKGMFNGQRIIRLILIMA